jgi:hypothetical protein
MQRTMMRESEIGLQADLRHWQERARKAEAENRRMREALKTIKALQQGYLGGDEGRKSGRATGSVGLWLKRP